MHPRRLSEPSSCDAARSARIDEEDVDRVFQRLAERGLEHWADPGRQRAGQINRNDGGRGMYFLDPDGHLLEVITRPYGSGAPGG